MAGLHLKVAGSRCIYLSDSRRYTTNFGPLRLVDTGIPEILYWVYKQLHSCKGRSQAWVQRWKESCLLGFRWWKCWWLGIENIQIRGIHWLRHSPAHVCVRVCVCVSWANRKVGRKQRLMQNRKIVWHKSQVHFFLAPTKPSGDAENVSCAQQKVISAVEWFYICASRASTWLELSSQWANMIQQPKK